MAELKPTTFKTKDGIPFEIRSATPSDAQEIWNLAKSVMAEEIYQLTSSDEFTLTTADEEKWIQSHIDHPYWIALIAVLDGRVMGLLDFTNGHRQRISHTGEFGMSVAKELRGKGIGAALLETLLSWAKSTGKIEKVCLQVHANNLHAQALYRKLGFEVEGVKKRDLKYGPHSYVDSVIMGRFL